MGDTVDDVSQWNAVNNELDKVLRAAGNAKIATTADKERIAQREKEEIEKCREHYESRKAELQAQLSQLNQNLGEVRAIVRQQENGVKDAKARVRDGVRQRGLLKERIQKSHLDMIYVDKEKKMAENEAKEAVAQLAEIEHVTFEVVNDLSKVQRRIERDTAVVQEQRTVWERCCSQQDWLKKEDERLDQLEEQVNLQEHTNDSTARKVQAEMNRKLRMELHEIDMETRQAEEQCRKACMEAKAQRLALEGPDVNGLKMRIREREKEVAQQQEELDRLNVDIREMQGMQGQAEALEVEVQQAEEAVQEAKAVTEVSVSARMKEVEKARLQYEQMKAKNDTSISTDMLRLYRDKLHSAVQQLVTLLGCTEEDLEVTRTSLDEETAIATKAMVDATTLAVFDNVDPRHHMFRLLNLKEAPLSLTGWGVTAILETGDTARVDLDNVVLPPLGSQLFYTERFSGSEMATKISFDTPLDWNQAGARLELLDHNQCAVATVRLGGHGQQDGGRADVGEVTEE